MVTPSLNKSFKFQSDWPKNSSQAYLLQSLLEDLEDEEGATLEKVDDGYVLNAKVDYPNNPDLVTESIYFDKDMNLKRVEVFNDDKAVRIKVVFDSINYKASVSDDVFDLAKIIDENCCNAQDEKQIESDNKSETGSTPNGNSEKETGSDQNTNKLEDVIYPLYVPANTYLTGKDTVDIAGGERVILTFAGEKNFTLVQETSIIPDEFEVIPVYGDPLMMNDTIAALSGNSLHWSKNSVDYYLTGDNLTGKELMTIATSLANTTATVAEK